jgi:GntR family transcriptional regulator
VAEGARERLLSDRRLRFAQQYIEPMLAEGRRLGMDTEVLVSMLRDVSQRNGETRQ